MPFEQFPYTNFHELNLDWMIKEVKNVADNIETTAENAALAKYYAEQAEQLMVNVGTPQMYGAVGDGINDDTEAFEKMFENHINCLLPESTYLLKHTLNVPNNIHLFGTGPLSKIIIDSAFAGDYIFKNEDAISHFNIHDLYIDINDQNVGGIKYFNPYNECILKNVTIYNAPYNAAMFGDPLLDPISQSLYLDNCLFAGSVNVSNPLPLLILNKVYEANIANTKLLFRQNNMASVPCLQLNHCWDFYLRGNSFAFTTACAIEVNDSTRYFRIIANTYENIGSVSNTMIELKGASASKQVLGGMIMETPYYNVTKTISLSYCQRIFSLGEMTFTDDGTNSRNICINTDYGDIVNKSLSIAFNGNFLVLPDRNFIQSSYDNEHGYQVNVSETSGLDAGMSIYKVKGTKTEIIRITATDVENRVNNGAIVLKDSNGTRHFIRVDTNGQLVVTNS